MQIIEDDLVFHRKGVPIISWPLNKIRRYGYEDTLFCFETGKSCKSGSGIFSLKSKSARYIFSAVHGKLLVVLFYANLLYIIKY